MYNQMYPFGGGFNPFINHPNDDNNLKLSADQYGVYVNGDFVGSKTLHNQNDTLSDIDDFLRMQGFTEFSASVEGDHYEIQANGQVDDIANALSVYFNNR
jgi:hypothetical protein